MKNFFYTVMNERFYLHIILGAPVSMLLISLFPDLVIRNLKPFELTLIFAWAGVVIGGFFEWIQSVFSGRKSENWILVALHYLKIIPQTHKVEGNIFDAFATGIGFLFGALIYWFFFL